MAVGSSYRARKEHAIDASVCLYHGCNAAQSGDSLLCVAHRDAERQRVRLSKRKRRRMAAARSLCSRCARRPRAKSSDWGCAVCLVELGALKRSTSFVTEDVNKRARVEARIVVGSFQKEEGRSRYRGGQARRGPPGKVREDAQDLLAARVAIDKARLGLAYAASAEVRQLPLVQRREVERAALSQADHGARFLEAVLERHRYDGRMPEKDNEDGD